MFFFKGLNIFKLSYDYIKPVEGCKGNLFSGPD